MKNVLILLAILLSSLLGTAQEVDDEQDRKVRFGFNLSANYSNLYSTDALPDNATISNGFGFGLGVLMDYQISERFVLSPKSELSFYNSSVKYPAGEGTARYDVFPEAVNVMVHAAYKMGKGGMRPYFFAGPNFRLPVSRNSGETTTFETTPDLAIDLGFGLENWMKHFVFAPELKYSLGFMNINNNPALLSLNFHSVSLVLNFK